MTAAGPARGESPGARASEPPGQVVDTDSAREFMRQTLEKVTEVELGAIAGELQVKHERFRDLLDRSRRAALGEADLRRLFRSIFSTRRRVGELLERTGPEALVGWIGDLLDGGGPVDARFQVFHDRLDGLPQTVRYDLAGELLHYTDPDRYWLWTRWVWDPGTRTGALPLVTMEEVDLAGASIGETYLRVGQAIAFVHATGQASGYTRFGRGAFGVDVYLACVYCVYVYTTVRMRMTQEFNRVIPPLPELCRRFLGVHGMEV